MPGSSTTPGRPGARAHAPFRVAFRFRNRVGTRDMNLCEAQWLAYALPYRRFAAALTDDRARLAADVDRYCVIASDAHRLLVAGLPAHCDVVSRVKPHHFRNPRPNRNAHRNWTTWSQRQHRGATLFVTAEAARRELALGFDVEEEAVALSTAQQRTNWKSFECNEHAMKRTVFGPDQVLVAPPTIDAWKALACVLSAHGYNVRPADTSTYNCRPITGGTGKSLHSYGIALDINANTNPYQKTPDNRKVRYSNKATQDERAVDVNLNRADTDFTPEIIADVFAIKTTAGKTLFDWGGVWESIKDTMHFQMDVSPSDLEAGIDWNTVKGAGGVEPADVAWNSGPAPKPLPVPPSGVTLGKFELVYPVVEKWEGNFDNDPDDPGGPTNMGITQADLSRWRSGQSALMR